MSTFNIGAQNAAAIHNVGGDMVIEGGLHASANWSYELRTEIARARDEVGRLPLSPPVRASVDSALRAAAEATDGEPDKRCAAEMLTKATRTLKEAGALTSAGTSLLEALRRAASILGPLGATVLALL